MEDTIEKSKAYFDSGFGCAESVLKAIAEHHNIHSETIPRIATGFCAGMARTGGTCGAVTGAVLALNLLLGRNHAEGDKEKNYEAVQKLIAGFRISFGDVSCPGLTGVDLGTEKGHMEFDEKNLHDKCREFVGEATRMVMKLVHSE
ncbi:MAG: C_GCAxxG_C_C family protein [Bacteroidales bacterium]|nr:C_GCAxxG_C_C family protein [Bacteroidales bacterium]